MVRTRLVVTGVALSALALVAAALAQQPQAPSALAADAARPADASAPGGDTTVYATGRNAFSFPAANLSDPERTRFVIGNSFFKRNWVQAPASTKARDGLGPHFIARSCAGCHTQDGRGEPPDFHRGLADQPVGLLLRLSVPGQDKAGGPLPDPVYGDQFANFAVQGVKPEGRITIRYEEVAGKFADGTRYKLQKPVYGFSGLNYGPMAKGVMVSPRLAPQVIGMGLLEAIADEDILANARAQAEAGGAIRGQVNEVWDQPSQRMRIGRFGWKANVATVAHQTAGAFHGDMGITSSLFPDEACMPRQRDCVAAPRGAQGKAPEVEDKIFEQVVFYTATLAPPGRRGAGDPQVLRGQQLFADAQCAVCHRPTYRTGEGPFPRLTSKALSGQTIHPYTDLLVHDMGEGLADGRPDFKAGGHQWRTPPLWGIGLIRDVNNHTRLLHDGRADGVLQAVLWHAGEAQASRDAVLKFSAEERAALVKFVESL